MAFWHLVATLPLGAGSVLVVLYGPSRVAAAILMGISWYAITITAVDVLATTDVREKEE